MEEEKLVSRVFPVLEGRRNNIKLIVVKDNPIGFQTLLSNPKNQIRFSSYLLVLSGNQFKTSEQVLQS
jgi:hypothetical protein